MKEAYWTCLQIVMICLNYAVILQLMPPFLDLDVQKICLFF